MARKEKIAAYALVLALAVSLILSDIAVASSSPQDLTCNAKDSSEKRHYPDECIRKEPCPADSGAECKTYSIPVLPCSCSEVKRCDPTASGCSESTIAGLRACDF